MSPFLLHRFTRYLSEKCPQYEVIRSHPKLELAYNTLIGFVCSLDDNGPEETEAQNDVTGNWWLDLVAVQSEVAQTRNTVVDSFVHSFNGHRTDVGATHTCKNTKGSNIIKL